MTLDHVLTKYPSVEAHLCLHCGHGVFFDKGPRLTCEACGADRPVYETEEKGNGYQAEAVITSDTEIGLMRGIDAYLERFPPPGYGTKVGPVSWGLKKLDQGQVWQVTVKRATSCD